MLVAAIVAAGILGAVVAWRLVDAGRVSVWAAMPTVSGASGLAAAATGPVALSPRVSWPLALGSGAAAGLALYGATVAFVRLARRHPSFDRQVQEVYARRGRLSLGMALLLGAGLTAVGEELFWRGLVQGRLGQEVGALPAAAVTWGAYAAVNAASGSLPFVAAAVVPGAVWGGLALWTQGVLASVGCHATWTALMVARPPVELPVARGRGSGRRGPARDRGGPPRGRSETGSEPGRPGR